jgi:hypothetical protein
VTKRWSESQHLVAAYLREHGWPYAEPVGNGRGGPDVTGTPGLAVEVKSAKLLDLPGWLRQCEGQAAGAVPVLVYRPQGFGEAGLRAWPMIMPLWRGAKLLRQAGYGSEA